MRKLAFPYTPKHGSWLKMADIVMGIFQRGCLSRGVERLPALRLRIVALEADRNAQNRTIVWQFTCPDAREKLSPLAHTRLTDHSLVLLLQAYATSRHTRQ